MTDKIDVIPALVKGDFRTFGAIGPAYEVLSIHESQQTIGIRVLETGEELDYSVERAIRDPEAA